MATRVERHKERYEGWNESGADEGYVRRFDKTDYRWVVLALEEIPKEIREQRRGD
jgi:hypothetical protein